MNVDNIDWRAAYHELRALLETLDSGVLVSSKVLAMNLGRHEVVLERAKVALAIELTKGLLKAAIRDDNPVIFLEAEMMYGWKGEVPEEEYLVPLDQAEVKRPGKDLTLMGYGKVMRLVLEAAELLAREGFEAEVIDIRSVRPLDMETLVRSVNRTSRCVVVDEDWPVASVGSYIAWHISRSCFDYLDAPVELVSMEDVPMPYNHGLELAAQPSLEKILEAAKTTL